MGSKYGEYIQVNERGHLEVDGCDCVDLAQKYGTPLFAVSERTIRENYRRFYNAFASKYPKVVVCFGNKSNNSLAVRKILQQEGAGGDCFGLGELELNLLTGVDPTKIVLNGSDKKEEELEAAVHAGVTINVDNPTELEMLNRIASNLNKSANIHIRVRPALSGLDREIITDYRYSPPK